MVSLLILAAALIAGCNYENGSSGGRTKSSSPSTAGSGSATIQSVTYDQLEKAIEAKKGSILVVDVWATW
jgi:hypothetical protein